MTVRNLAEGFSDLHKMANDPTPRIGFGIPFLDEKTNGGLAKGQCAMVMAFSHVGKTSLAINAISNNSHIPVLFFSIEMPWEQVASKLTAMEVVRATTIIEEDFRGDRQPGYVQEVIDKHRLLLCDDSPDLSMKSAEASYHEASEILAAKGQPPPRLVVFDYLELVSGNGMMEKSTQVDKAAERVHMFSRKMKTSAILLHQVGKGEAGGGAEPLDLGSGRYGGYQTMDIVVGMYKPGAKKGLASDERYRLSDQRVLQLLKNRVTGQLDEPGRAHRLDATSMRLTDWNDRVTPLWSSPPQVREFQFEREVLGV